MARLPPPAYLAIYNPTLLPSTQTDDEDAREHAHICFYTSQEQAVSRDRMLRQIGLAKALVNFSSIFSSDPHSTYVSSQKTKLITVSPEANWWIHAAFELERLPRSPPSLKRKLPSKEGSQDAIRQEHLDQPNEAVLEVHILQGYEEFKLLHGSLSELLLNDRASLERDLERFFTLWAAGRNLGSTVKLPPLLQSITLHPSSHRVDSLISSFAERLRVPCEVIVLCPPFILYPTSSKVPASFCRYIMSLFPPLLSQQTPKASSEEFKGFTPDDAPSLLSSLGLPKKWSWSPYLSFGRSSNRQSIPEDPVQPDMTPAPFRSKESSSTQEGVVDKDALVDALRDSVPRSKEDGVMEGHADNTITSLGVEEEISGAGNTTTEGGTDELACNNDEKSKLAFVGPQSPSVSEGQPLPSFVNVSVHLPLPDTMSTQTANVLCLARDNLIIAVVPVGSKDVIEPSVSDQGREELEACCNSLLLEVLRALHEPAHSSEAEAEVHLLTIHPPRAHIISSPSEDDLAGLLPLHAHLAAGLARQVFSRTPHHWLIAERHESMDFYIEVDKKDLNLTEVEKLSERLIAAAPPSSSSPLTRVSI